MKLTFFFPHRIAKPNTCTVRTNQSVFFGCYCCCCSFWFFSRTKLRNFCRSIWLFVSCCPYWRTIAHINYHKFWKYCSVCVTQYDSFAYGSFSISNSIEIFVCLSASTSVSVSIHFKPHIWYLIRVAFLEQHNASLMSVVVACLSLLRKISKTLSYTYTLHAFTLAQPPSPLDLIWFWMVLVWVYLFIWCALRLLLLLQFVFARCFCSLSPSIHATSALLTHEYVE